MVYKTPIEDFKYNLEMLNYDSVVSNIDKFKDYDAETLLSIVSEIGRLNEQEALSSNKVGDREGLKYIAINERRYLIFLMIYIIWHICIITYN